MKIRSCEKVTEDGEKEQVKEQSELLGTEKISKLLYKLSAPSFVAIAVAALYNLVDSIYIGRFVGTEGLAGITIALPIQMFIIAVAGGIGSGGASIISRLLGSGLKDEANTVLGHVISIVVIFSTLSGITGFIFQEPLLRSFGAGDIILPYAADYLRIILGGIVIFAFTLSVYNIVRAEGNARTAMYVMIASGFINIVLDPVLITGFELGIRGAAFATVISQAAAAAYMVCYFAGGLSSLSVSWRNFILQPYWMREIILVGAPSFTWQAAGSLMFLAVNKLLSAYGGDISIAAFGIISRLIMIFFMPVMGIVQGMQPIVGFNYGAGKTERVNEVLNLALRVTTYVSCSVFIIIMLFPGYLLRVFSTDTVMIAAGTEGMRLIFAASFLIGFQMVVGGFYQAMGKARQALLLSMTRQIIFLIPLVLILPILFGLTGIWMAFPLADIFSFLVTAAVYEKDKRREMLFKSVTAS